MLLQSNWMLKSKVHRSCSLCSVCWCMCGCLRVRLCVISFFLINLLCVFFINLLHLHKSSPPTPLPRSLPPVHRWGFSTSAVTGPKQGGRLALPPGVAKDKTSWIRSKRAWTRQNFTFHQLCFCIHRNLVYHQGALEIASDIFRVSFSGCI